KGLGRDSIDRLRRNLYSLWANDALNRKVNNREGAFRGGTGKVCFSGVLKYIYEIFEVFKCHGARQSIADLRRLSKSPACLQSARYRMARSQQEIQSRDFYPSSSRLTDRRGTRDWGVPCADFGPQRNIGRCRKIFGIHALHERITCAAGGRSTLLHGANTAAGWLA